MELVVPSAKYKESFLQALAEYRQENVSAWDTRADLKDLNPEVLEKDFTAYINKLVEAAKGIGLPTGYVAHTSYWLIDNNEFIGRVDIRHSLAEKLLKEGGHIGYDIRPLKRNQGYGKKILQLALPKAKALEITKVLVTCDETNIASKKVIERNGGFFEDAVLVAEGRPKKLRYWFALS